MRAIFWVPAAIIAFNSIVFAQQRVVKIEIPQTETDNVIIYLSDSPLLSLPGHSATVATPDGKYLVSDAQAIVKEIEHMQSGRKCVLVADRQSGQLAMELIDTIPQRLAGVVLLSVVPISRTPNSLDVWAPRGATWKIPFWVTVSNDAAQASQCLLMWRKISSLKPQDSNFTIDPQSDPSKPSPELKLWIQKLLDGVSPQPGSDSQEAAERMRYRPAAEYLFEQMKTGGSATPGRDFTKTDGPFRVSGYAPADWFRITEGERKFQKGVREYSQLFFKAGGDEPRSARVFGCMGHEESERILDDYETYLREAGYLLIRYKRWKTSDGTAVEINSILWPVGEKWHRWIMLCGTSGQNPADKSAALVVVQDGSEKPDTQIMASSFKRFIKHAETSLVKPEILIKND